MNESTHILSICKGQENHNRVRIDPFRHIPGEIVGLVIKKLPPPDTERLRRVSRSWKTLSEFFNGAQAIRKHCPMLEPLAKACPERANVHFRRWLCIEQSVAAGLAHDVIEYQGVRYWDIRNHTLVAARFCGTVYMCALKPGLCSTTRSRELSLKTIIPSWVEGEWGLGGIFVTMDGDAVCLITAEAHNYIVRVSSCGKIVWLINQEWKLATVSSQKLYVIQHFTTDILGRKIFMLDTFNLSNGMLVGSSVLIRVATSHSWTRSSIGSSEWVMVMSTDERHIAIKVRNKILGFLDTTDGHLIFLSRQDDIPPSEQIDQSWVTAEPNSSDFCEVLWKDGHNLVIVSRYIHRSYTNIYTRIPLMVRPTEVMTGHRGTDLDRGIVFTEYLQEDGSSTFGVDPLSNRDKHDLRDVAKGGFRKISAPDQRTGQRKEVSIQEGEYRENCGEMSDFFGWWNGYLVFHQVSKGNLVVLSFYPKW